MVDDGACDHRAVDARRALRLKIALDTNVLVYAEDLNGGARRDIVHDLIDRLLQNHELVIPAQCLGELHRVLVGKVRMPADSAARAVLGWADLARVAATRDSTIKAALDLIVAHPHQIWDAIILSAAVEAECVMLLSEDMQDGFVHRGVTVVDPFAETPHPLLASLLEP